MGCPPALARLGPQLGIVIAGVARLGPVVAAGMVNLAGGLPRRVSGLPKWSLRAFADPWCSRRRVDRSKWRTAYAIAPSAC